MDWVYLGTVVAVLVAATTVVLNALGILEKLGTLVGKAWARLRSGATAPPQSLEPIDRLPFGLREPVWDFALLPQHFTVDLAAQFPHIEVSFFVVSFLTRPIRLTEVELSLRLYGAPPIEDIKLRHKDWQVDPKTSAVVYCRRNLTDLERTKLPWKTGRETASFDLSSKATDGKRTFSYGPVSARVIEGWVNVPVQQ